MKHFTIILLLILTIIGAQSIEYRTDILGLDTRNERIVLFLVSSISIMVLIISIYFDLIRKINEKRNSK